jgi:flap endonuclease-1
MGIKGLTKFLKSENCAGIKEIPKSPLKYKVLAIDASILLYQYVIQIRTQTGGFMQNLTNASGKNTSHIYGFFTKTISFLESGIRPVYVFDGAPPELKNHELSKRSTRKKEAQEALKEAHAALKEAQEALEDIENMEAPESTANIDEINKLSKYVTITREHVADIKRLLDLMGITYIDAPCEAEAQCVYLNYYKLVDAVYTEDMDSLALGRPGLVIVRGLNNSKMKQALEINLNKVLESLQLTREQFIDFCILCGCDYCPTISGIGPKRAYSLIKTHKTIDALIVHLEAENAKKQKHVIPDNFMNSYKEVQKLFLEPKVLTSDECKVIISEKKKIDRDGLMNFLVTENSFDKERVATNISRIEKVPKPGKTIESFFAKKS